MQELSTIVLYPPSPLPGTFPTYPSFEQGEFTITSVARVFFFFFITLETRVA